MADELIKIGVFGTILCFAVLKVMAIIYAGNGRRTSEVGRPGFDLNSEREHGPNRINYFFDPAMTTYWTRNNGWLVLWVSRVGICASLLSVILGLVVMIAL